MDITGFTRAIEKQNLRCEGVAVLRHGEQIAARRWAAELDDLWRGAFES